MAFGRRIISNSSILCSSPGCVMLSSKLDHVREWLQISQAPNTATRNLCTPGFYTPTEAGGVMLTPSLTFHADELIPNGCADNHSSQSSGYTTNNTRSQTFETDSSISSYHLVDPKCIKTNITDIFQQAASANRKFVDASSPTFLSDEYDFIEAALNVCLLELHDEVEIEQALVAGQAIPARNFDTQYLIEHTNLDRTIPLYIEDNHRPTVAEPAQPAHQKFPFGHMMPFYVGCPLDSKLARRRAMKKVPVMPRIGRTIESGIVARRIAKNLEFRLA